MSWSDFTALNMELLCKSTIPLICAYTKERKSEYRGDISMFILFLTAKTWDQPRCPAIAEQMQ